ncbi:MAG: iron-containing alcohol dehydrogenase [Methylocystaceae bacterium]
MQNFEYLSPTKIIFGHEAELKSGKEITNYGKKVLFHFGGGSIKSSGLHDKIIASLKTEAIEFVELGGVMPNPRLSLVQEGIRICREQQIEFILAVGGGSVIDSAKAIGVGVPYQGDVWDFYEGKAIPKESLPVGAVITIAAAGSESSMNSVITNEDGWLKRGLGANITRPKFAILNPELTFTLPSYQTACGAVDIMAHVMERYFTNELNVDLTDRLCEGAMKSVLKNAPLAIEHPDDYNARAEIMWAGTIAHNGFLGVGRVEDWASHQIEHELSGMFDIAHGAGLSIIFPAWMKYVYRQNIARMAQFAVRVFDVDYNFETPENTVLEGIKQLEIFYQRLGLPTRLHELDIKEDVFGELADKCRKSPTGTTGNFMKLNREDIVEILKLAQ